MTFHVAVDIESLGTPEKSGYDIIIPNYAVVAVPENPMDDLKHYAYVKIPVQQQIDAGLQMDAGALNFWMNICNLSYTNAYAEIISTLTLDEPVVYGGDDLGVCTITTNPLDVWNTLRYDESGDERDVEIWGNGCHFDCSILQANHRKLFGQGELWKYSSPQNARSLKNRLNAKQREDMDNIVAQQLPKFVNLVATHKITGLELHHPLYDAAREAIQISFCLNLFKQ